MEKLVLDSLSSRNNINLDISTSFRNERKAKDRLYFKLNYVKHWKQRGKIHIFIVYLKEPNAVISTP